MCSDGQGCFGHVFRLNEKIIFQACAAHRYNLLMKDSCSSDELINLFKILNAFAVITKDSAKRMEKWSDIVSEFHRCYKNDINLQRKPVTVGPIRWSGRHMNDILAVMEKTTRRLQKPALYIYEMVNEISRLYRDISKYLDENKKSELISKAVEFANTVTFRIYSDNDIILQNGFSANISCKRNISDFISGFISTIQTEMQNRFINEFKTNEGFYKGIQALDPSSFQTNQLDEPTLLELCQYIDYEPSVTLDQFKEFKAMFINITSNDHQYKKLKDDEKMNWLIKFLCTQHNENRFQKVFELYKYVFSYESMVYNLSLFSLPCTEVKCESDFSHLKNVKKCNRITLNDKTLENEMLIFLNKNLLLDLDFGTILNKIGESSNKMKKLLLL